MEGVARKIKNKKTTRLSKECTKKRAVAMPELKVTRMNERQGRGSKTTPPPKKPHLTLKVHYCPQIKLTAENTIHVVMSPRGKGGWGGGGVEH